jgi:hypothetical protein
MNSERGFADPAKTVKTFVYHLLFSQQSDFAAPLFRIKLQKNTRTCFNPWKSLCPETFGDKIA